MPYSPYFLERFWSKVDKKGSDECWEWIAGKYKDGYGQIATARSNLKEKSKIAHRVSWQLHNGPIPEGMWVLHRCDNPPCVNPDHLFLGTALDNSKDKIAKDRSGCAKLSNNDISKIREMLEHEFVNEIARKYGVSRMTIIKIRNGLSWKHS